MSSKKKSKSVKNGTKNTAKNGTKPNKKEPKNKLSVQVLDRYKQKYGKLPKNAQQLVNFGKKTSILMSYTDAKIIIGNTETKQKYKNNAQVLITKNRTGIVRYFGSVPEIKGANKYDLFYGIELNDGSLGIYDGSINGHRYFKCSKKKGLFIRPGEIRRALTERDHKRTASYMEAIKIKEELKIRGTKALHDREVTPEINGNHINGGLNVDNDDDDDQPRGTIVIRNDDMKGERKFRDDDDDDDDAQTVVNAEEVNDDDDGDDNDDDDDDGNDDDDDGDNDDDGDDDGDDGDDNEDENKDDTYGDTEMDAEEPLGSPLSPEVNGTDNNDDNNDDNDDNDDTNEENKDEIKDDSDNNIVSINLHPATDDNNENNDNNETESNNNEAPIVEQKNENVNMLQPQKVMHMKKKSPRMFVLNEYGFSNIHPLESLLKYILRQDDNAQDKLLDIYSHPKTHASFIETFKQLRDLNVTEQTAVWKQLMPRWQTIINKNDI